MRRCYSSLIALSLVSMAFPAPTVQQVLPSPTTNMLMTSNGCTVNATFTTKNNTKGYTFTLGKKNDYMRLKLPQKLNFTGYDGIIVSVKNEGTTPALFDFSLRGALPANNESVLGLWHTLAPGAKKNLLFWRATGTAPYKMQFELPETDEPVNTTLGYEWKFDPTLIESIQFWNNNAASAMKLTVDDIRFVKKRTDYTNLMDRFGQWNRYSFENKVTSITDLTNRNAAERDSLAAMSNVSSLTGVDAWLTTRATGKWRIERATNGNQYFVTPQGKRFWMLGLNNCDEAAGPVIQNREAMYQDLPSKTGATAEFYGLSPHKTEGWVWNYNFYNQNLAYKFGANYKANWADRTVTRLQKYGFNTTTCKTADSVLNTTVPNVGLALVSQFPVKITTPWFLHSYPIDPYSPQFESWTTTFLAPTVTKLNARPNVVGLHADNELSWGNRSDSRMQYSIPIGILNSAITQPAKVAVLTMLKTRYRNDIAGLNTAWASNFANWAALEPQNAWGNRTITAAMDADFKLILSAYADKYYSTIKKVLTTLNFNGLYLGSRDAFDATPKVIFDAQAKYVDAISINLYSEDDSYWAEINALAKPVLISEFAYSASDSGHYCPSPALEVGSKADRATRAFNYLVRAAGSKNVVGACWWCYIDNPATGRWADDERWNLGVVDITDTPDTQLVTQLRNFATALPTLRPAR